MVDAAGSNQTPKVSTSSFAWNANTTSLGIGTASPTVKLDIVGSIARIANAGTAEFIARNSTLSTNWEFGVDGSGNGFIYSGQASPMVFSTSGTERMRLDSSGNLGLGVTPSVWKTGTKAIEIGSTGSALYSYASNHLVITNNATFNGTDWIYSQTGQPPSLYTLTAGTHYWDRAVAGTAGNVASLITSMILDSSGNLGIAITPSVWASGRPTLEFGGSVQGTIAFNGNVTNGGAIWTNSYFNGSANFYKSNGAATLFTTGSGQFDWNVAPSGTANASFSWTTAMTLSNAGNLGIGETSPPAPGGADARSLTLKGVRYPQFIYKATAAPANSTTWRTISRDTLEFQIQTVNDAITTEQTAYEIVRTSGSNSINYHRWYTGTTECMRLATSGALGVGTTTPTAKFHAYGAGADNRHRSQSSDSGGVIVEMLADGASVGVLSVNTNHPLVFQTNSAERMRISASGNMLVGTTTSNYSAGLLQVGNGGATGKFIINTQDSNFCSMQIGNPGSGTAAEASICFISSVTSFGTAPTSTHGNQYIWAIGPGVYGQPGNYFTIGNPGFGSANIRLAWNGTSWLAVSDERVKNITGEITNANEIIKDWRTVFYSMKSDEFNSIKTGLIAQDVIKTLPEVVDVPEKEMDDDGKLNPLSLNYQEIIPVLIKAIQEQQAMIENLTTRLAAVEIK
jgi:hypothetical protein